MEINLENVGDIIASRTFVMAGDEGREIKLLIGRPQPYPDGADFFCPYQITGIGDGRLFYAAGVDELQALQLALKIIKVILDLHNKENGNKIRWSIDDEGDMELLYDTIVTQG